MKLLNCILIIFTVMSQVAVSQITEIKSSQYTNPVIRGYNPDPSICRVGEDYYMISSSGYLYTRPLAQMMRVWAGWC